MSSRRQSNLFQFFSLNSNSKPNPSAVQPSFLEEPLKIEFKSEPEPPISDPKHNPYIEEDSPLAFKTLKKPKLKFLEEEDPQPTASSILKKASLSTTLTKTNEMPSENKENCNPKPKNKTKTVKINSKEEDSTFFINVEKENQQVELNLDDFDDVTPWWATKEKCKDKQMHAPQDPNYDPTTLYVPPEEKKKLTPTMRQFWEIKSENYDKVLFFKLGKFYELFYEDAYIGHKHLDLNWMGRKMHVGFPEKAIERYAITLVDLGFKVGVIEQMETPKEMEERLKSNKKSGKNEEKTIQRGMVEIMTKGTYVSGNEANGLESKFLLAVRLGFGYEISFCALESISNYITMGWIVDDENYTHFKTLVCQIKPTEIVYDPENVNSVVLKIIKSALLTPVLSPLYNKQSKWHSGVAYNHLEKLYGAHDEQKENWPSNIDYFFRNKSGRDLVFSALSGCFSYLEQVLILDKVLVAARYAKYDPKLGLKTSMNLDSQALQHLEIFETACFKQTEEGTLFKYLDKTVSPGGRRMLKRWLCAPLMNKERISERLDVLEDLQRHSHLREGFRKGLKELPDLERLCAKVYQYSIKKNGKIIYFEDVSTLRLREFKSLLNNLVKAEALVLDFQAYVDGFKSQRLKKLVSYSAKDSENLNQDFQDIYISEPVTSINIEGGQLPCISGLVNELLKLIIWEGKDQSIPTPGFGLIKSYDQSRESKKVIEEKLSAYLKTIRKRFSDHSIEYCHAKFRYELEIPEKHVKGTKKPEDFEFTSAKAGYQRFLTEEIREMVKELEEVEDEMKKDLKTFAEDVFRYFRESYNSMDAFLAILSELDVLSSLSLVSFNADGVMCRPEVYDYDESLGPFIELIAARHPCLSSIDFIPNDIYLGNFHQTSGFEHKNLMLLTGPNMGGKSTVLRMTSILVIMAQIGCYVPAKALRFTLVDRIFTRLGASDKLMEGKSTFFIEMEETVNILKSGTVRSLAILDELGRGTSTFDGVALAFSVLKFLLENLRCRTIFATHYHVLIEEFRIFPEIEFYHMDAVIDEVNEKVQFLYKLKEGECHQSFGLNVAKVLIRKFMVFCFYFGFFFRSWELIKRYSRKRRKKLRNLRKG